ncbi:unnamed protein product, partial [Ixodes hexagonus]
QVTWSCPCCEYGVFTSENMIVEVRPWRSKTRGERWPLIERTVTLADGHVFDSLPTEQKGAVLVMRPYTHAIKGLTKFKAMLYGKTHVLDVFMFMTKTEFTKQKLLDHPGIPPVRGSCSVKPPEGVAAHTYFEITCGGYTDPEKVGLLYEFFLCFSDPSQLPKHFLDNLQPLRQCELMKSARDDGTFQGFLPMGNQSQTSVSMVVYVSNFVGQFLYEVVGVRFTAPSCSDVHVQSAEAYEQKEKGAPLNQVIAFMKSTSTAMNSDFYKHCSSQVTQARGEQVRMGYIEYLKKTSITSEGDLHTQAEAFQDIVSQSVSNMSADFTGKAVDLLSDYTKLFDSLTSVPSTARVPEKTVAVGAALIAGMKTILDLSSPADTDTPQEIKAEVNCKTAERIVDNMAYVTNSVARVVDTEDADHEIRVDDYEIWIRETKREGYLGSSDGTKVLVEGEVNQLTSIVFPSSPFRCDNSNRFSNTQAMRIDAKNGTEGPINYQKSGVKTVLKRPQPLVFKGVNDTFFTSFANMSIHTIEVMEPGVYVKLDIVPVTEDERLITAVTTNRVPISSDFLKQNRRNLLHIIPNERRFEPVPQGSTLTIAVLPLTSSTKQKLEDRFYKSKEDYKNVSYSLRSIKYSCHFWNASLRTWSTSGCRVLHFSDNQFVRCDCDHASLFTGGLFIAPHPIDFTNLAFLFRGMSRNLVMFVVVTIVWVLYGAVMIWAFRKDSSDEVTGGIEYLSENEPNDTYGYLLSFYTWFRGGSGTTSKVSIMIHGSNCDSRTVVIRDGGKNPFALQAGGRDWYFLSHDSDIGTIESIDITIESKGKHPSWTLSTAVVRDLQTSSRTIFLIEETLEPDADKGSSTFTFQPTESSILRSPFRIFKARVIRYFREEHLIFSIFSRLPTGNFTRKQRASVALLLVLSGMMVCLMFYGLNTDEEEIFRADMLYSLVELPPWNEVVIAVQSTLIVTPFVFLVVFLFERSRPQTFHRKSVVPKVPVEGSVHDWLEDDMVRSSPTGKVPKERLTNNAEGYLFPTWASITAWILCIGGSLISSILIVLYGLTYGYYRSLSWLRCNLFNVIVTEFMVHPVKLLVMSAIVAGIFRTPVEMENIPLRFIE